MQAFPSAVDCVRLVDSKSDDPRKIRIDAALSLLYGTGCLVSEILELGTAHIEGTETETRVAFKGGRGGAPLARTVALSGKAKLIFDRHLDGIGLDPERLLFVSERGHALNGSTLNAELARRCAALGFVERLTTGDLRRACVRHCLERGMRADQLAVLLGVSDVNTVVALGR
ncbi:tyrosine-type recombinase/integrase [Bradyrhizobium sp. 200]|uniref:tyrosine-type recombinase/integrase n=1 Tax=Bradyrhizobium sp. 200 TaxID=2782665 RepID=UPI001FFFAE12|nr:tyrosine-type recombinase/integrase [Bradyrhizobium sp. 200]UPJ53413.1 tyrosine-type recombinase/integrase [Bradyrhizobium sp. 200]